MKKIFLYDQDRALLIFLLLSNLLKDEIIYVTYKNKVEKLNKLKGKKLVFDSNDLLFKNRIKMAIKIKKFRREYKNLLNEIECGKTRLYGIHYFELAQRIFYKESLIALEEGTATYSQFPVTLRGKIKYFLVDVLNIFFNIRERQDFKGKKIEKFYLTENLCKEMPEEFKEKAEVINLKNLWDNKIEEEQKLILDVFNFNEEILKKVTEDTIMLITQPVSEDGIISEEEKIEIYSKIIDRYKNQSIVIKPHPREKTDYSKYFLNCYVMKERYPIEILELVGIKIKKVVTLFSTAAFGLGKNVAVDFYGTEVNEKLFKRFGTQDSLMKRNVFL